jgi:hypothetical protein
MIKKKLSGKKKRKPRSNRSSTTKKQPNKIERWIVIPDIHCSVSGSHDADSLATVAEFLKTQRFDGFINLGDLIDFSIISHHNLETLRAVEGGRILEEYRCADAILAKHEQIIRGNNPKAKMIYLEGNHEHRISRYIDAHPECEGLLEVPKVLKLAERKIEWIPSWSEGALYELGKASFIHGLYVNDHHAKKSLQRYNNRNLFYGHSHDHQIYSSFGFPADNVMIGGSLGCLCRIPQNYLRNSPTRWVQMITIFELDKESGNFQLTPIRLHNHQLIYDGKVYGARKSDPRSV